MLRCPRCGQSYFAKVIHDSEVIDIKVSLDGDDIIFEMPKDNNGPIKLTHESMINCPRCNTCHDLQAWMLAWEDPLIYLELEKGEICRCGGEYVYGVNIMTTLQSKNKNTSTHPYACEVCGLPPGRNPKRYPSLEEIPYEPED